MTSAQSSVYLISLNYGPLIYLSAVLFKKGCIFSRNLSSDILAGWWDMPELWNTSSQQECRITLQRYHGIPWCHSSARADCRYPEVTEGAWQELQALFTLGARSILLSMPRALLQLSHSHSWITQATGTSQKVFEFGPSAMSH